MNRDEVSRLVDLLYADGVFMLHAFQKKSKMGAETPRRDIALRLRRVHGRSSRGEGRNHAIDRDVQHCPHHIGERVDDDHERDCNFIGKPERPQHNRQRRQRGKPAEPERGKRSADRENRQQTQIDRG